MSKRSFYAQEPEGHELQAPLTLPPSPTLLRIPGQWPVELLYIPQTEPASSVTASIFTTIRRFVPTVGNLKDLLGFPVTLVQRFLRPQRIAAVPVTRDDGARKKRLVDMGAGDPVTPTRSRRAQQSHQTRIRNASPQLQFPGTWPMSPPVFGPRDDTDIPPTPTSSLLDLTPVSACTSSITIDNTVLDIEMSGISDLGTPQDTSTPRQVFKTSEPSTARRVRAVPRSIKARMQSSLAAPSTQQHNTPRIQVWPLYESPCPKDFNPFTPNLFGPEWAPEPETKKHVANTTSQVVNNTRTKPTDREMTRKFLQPHNLITSNGSPIKLYNKFLDLDDSPKANGRHSKFDKQPAQTKQSYKGSVAHQIATADVADNAHKANDEYKAAHEARAIRNADLRAEEIVNSEYENLEQGTGYANDLSFLSDAPTPPAKKSVSFPTKVHQKGFYCDATVTEMLDSSLVSIKSCADFSEVEAALELSQLDEGYQDSHSEDTNGDSTVLSDTSTSSREENSLAEAGISKELASELHAAFAEQLSLAPPPPKKALKPLVAALSAEEEDALNKASKATDYGKVPLAPVVKGKLNAHDFGTLIPDMFNGDRRAWLNDNIVNEYLSILVEHEKAKEGYQHKKDGPAPPVHAFLSQWYSTMKAKKDTVKRWSARRQLGGKNFLDVKLVLIPICDNAHWRLLAIKPQERLIEYYDSLGGYGQKYTDLAVEYLQMELKDLFVEKDWTVVTEQMSEQQENASDCGIFAVLNALVLLRGEEHKRVISIAGMDDARRRVAATLLAGKPTTEMD